MVKMDKTLENYRYFSDSEGYLFVMMTENEAGVILDTDGIFIGFRRGLQDVPNIRLSHVLEELNADFLTDDFRKYMLAVNESHGSDKVEHSSEMTVGHLIKSISADIVKQKSHHFDNARYEFIPPTVKKVVKERLAWLSNKIPAYKNDISEYIKDTAGVNPKKLTVQEVRLLTERYVSTLANMVKEKEELEKFLKNS